MSYFDDDAPHFLRFDFNPAAAYDTWNDLAPAVVYIKRFQEQMRRIFTRSF